MLRIEEVGQGWGEVAAWLADWVARAGELVGKVRRARVEGPMEMLVAR